MAKVLDLPEGGNYPFKEGDMVLVLGEIYGMPGHVAVVPKDGDTVHYAYHTEDFRMLGYDEL